MKHLIILPFLLLSTLEITAQDSFEWLNPKPTGYRIQSITAVNENKLFACGDRGTVLKYESNTWTKINIGILANLFKVIFTSPNTGFIIGKHTILKTTNSGESWFSINNDFFDPIDFDFYDDDNGILNTSNRIYKTTNGGNSWSVLRNVSSATLLKYTSPNNLFYVVTNRIYKSSNSGNTWNEILNATNTNKSLMIIDSLKYAAVGDNLRRSYTTDGGATWNHWNQQISITVTSATIHNDSIFALASDKLYKIHYTTEGWVQIGGFFNQKSLLSISSDFLVAYNTNNNSYRYNIYKSSNSGNSWTNIYYGYYCTECFYPQIHTFPNSDTGFVTGFVGGFSRKTFDNFSSFSSFGDSPRLSYFTSTNSAFGINTGTGHTNLYVLNGIESGWFQVGGFLSFLTVIPQDYFYDIYFPNQINGYIVSIKGEVYRKFSENLTDWEKIHNGNSSFLHYRIIEVDNVLYLSGNNGTIKKSTNFGTSWEVLQTNYSSNIYLIREINNKLFALGQNGIYLTSTNNGNTWSQNSTNTNYNLLNILSLDSNRLVIHPQSNSYAYLLSNDGGNTWQTVSLSDLGIFIYDIKKDRDNKLILVTEPGGIIRVQSNGNPAPTNTFITQPTQNSTLFNEYIQFRWRKSLNANNYELQLSSDSLFNSVDLSINALDTIHRLQYCDIKFNGAYYARVRAENLGLFSDWSPSLRFNLQLGNAIQPKTFAPQFDIAMQDSSLVYNDILFLDTMNGFVAANDGLFFRSRNMGYCLESVNLNTVENLNTLHFINSQTGFVGGNNSSLYYTSNSGNNWSQVNLIHNGNINSISHSIDMNDTSLFVLLSSGKLLKSNLNFSSWEVLYNDSTSILKDVSVKSGDSILIATANGYLVRSINGFQSYNIVQIDGVNKINSIANISGKYWIACDSLKIIHSENFFDSYTVQLNQSSSHSLNKIYFANETHGWAVGENANIFSTSNSGLNWVDNKRSISTSANINSVYFYNNRIGWVCTGNRKTFITKSGDNLNLITINQEQLPTEFNLSQNFPNPFNPETKIRFSNPVNSFVKISIYDITGREVSVLVNEFLNTGNYEVIFNGSNFPSGVYFYTMNSEDFFISRKMILIK